MQNKDEKETSKWRKKYKTKQTILTYLKGRKGKVEMNDWSNR